MKFNIRTDGRPIDVPAIEQALQQADPSAMIDLDGTTASLRISTYLEGGELLGLMSGAGFTIPSADLERLPSECCGGCGG